jgi:hypothetical protein
VAHDGEKRAVEEEFAPLLCSRLDEHSVDFLNLITDAVTTRPSVAFSLQLGKEKRPIFSCLCET